MINQQFVSLSAQRTHELILERFHPERHQELLQEKESAKLAAEKEARIQALLDEYKANKAQATHKPSQQIDTTNKPAKKLDHKDSIKNMFKNKKAR
ncbi:MAG TPA: hypothetical protein VIO83_10255 [Pseudomonas sp.]